MSDSLGRVDVLKNLAPNRETGTEETGKERLLFLLVSGGFDRIGALVEIILE
jgi:hypothetical protein